MKKNHLLLLFLSILCFTTVPKELAFTPTNTIIVTDLDDVLIEKSFFLRSMANLKHIAGDYKKDTKKTDKKSDIKKDNSISGVTFHLLYHGMRKSYLTSYVAFMAEKLEKSRNCIDGTEKIYHYLKDVKGYPIVIATNKDRVSYDFTAQALGKKLTGLASTVFVAHPGTNPELIAELKAFADLPTTAASYKNFLNKALAIEPTEHILHAPSSKPDLAYYNYVEQNLEKDKNIIFIDDKKRNIDGFQNLQKTTSAERVGIVFKKPEQLAQEFVNLGILSETEDAQLLEDIRYPGIWGKAQLMGKKILAQ